MANEEVNYAEFNYSDDEDIRPADEPRRMRLQGDSDDEDNIRPADEPIRMRLNENNNPLRNINQQVDNIHDAIIASSKDARERENDDIAMAISASLLEIERNDDIDPEILKKSEEEYKAYEEALINSMIYEQNERIKSERKLLLPKFMERLEKLYWDENDRKLKAIISPIIEAWMNNEFDNIRVNENTYEIIIKYISTLYTIPLSKGRKPAIPEEEYNLLNLIILIE